MEWLNLSLIMDILLILIPVLILILLLFKFVVPKKPALGIGLAIGGGLLGTWLVNRRLKSAFNVEKKLAAHNKMMAEFKAKQKQRAQAVVANRQVIKTLEKQREKLSEEAVKHETELKLIDRELEDRHKLNEEIVSKSSVFLEASEQGSENRKALLKRYLNSTTKVTANNKATSDIIDPLSESAGLQIEGFHLFRVN